MLRQVESTHRLAVQSVLRWPGPVPGMSSLAYAILPVLASVEISSSRIGELVVYWQSLPRHNGLRLRRDVAPADIPALLPALSIVEFPTGTASARFRLYGTALTTNFGYDLTGMTLEEAGLSPERTRYWNEVYARVVATRQPLFGRDRAAERDFITFEWVKLPLSSDGTAVDMALCGYDFIR